MATALGDARFTPSGYTLLVSGHAPGAYHVIVYAHIAGTADYQAAERDVTILATPLLTVNGPAVGGSETSPFTVWGWAFDGASPSGVGIDAVHLYVYPNPGSGAPVVSLGAATLGQHRPDVGGFFQNPQFNPSGWSRTVGSGTLAAGQYLLIVYAHSTVNNTWIASTRLIYVDQPTVALTIDRGGGGTGGLTSSPGGLSCAGGAGTQALPCAASYTQTSQTAVTLTATADTGSVFTGWSGACSGTGLCQVTMTQARHVLATFHTYATTYYHLDTLGSVRAITDSQTTPAVIATHSYAPFGEDTAPLTGDPIRFTGKELDPETALQYFGARYYRNRIGRFMSVDPGQAGARLGRPQSWNAYLYALGNPLRFVDPKGLDPEDQNDTEIDMPDCSSICQEFNNWADGLVAAAIADYLERQARVGGGGGGQNRAALQSLLATLPDGVRAAVQRALDESNASRPGEPGGFRESGFGFIIDPQGGRHYMPFEPGHWQDPSTSTAYNYNMVPITAGLPAGFGPWPYDVYVHVHPGGTKNGKMFVQPPSEADISAAALLGTRVNFVVGAASKEVYFYDGQRVIHTIGLEAFKRAVR